MDDVLQVLIDAWRRGETTGVATVVHTFDSAPLPVGSTMLVLQDGSVVGSVSGGCVEGAVYDLAQQVVKGDPPRVQRYGISDDMAYDVGLTCGGILDVFVRTIDATSMPELEVLVADIERGSPVARATVMHHAESGAVGRHLIIGVDEVRGATGLASRAEREIVEDARELLAEGRNAVLTYGADNEPGGQAISVFVESWVPKPRMVIFGAVDFAAALAQQGRLLGYHVTICDARPVFATEARFPEADEVVIDWPHRWLSARVADGVIDNRTVICVLTHDPKFDVPVLEVALRLTGRASPAFVGAMGSRRTHADRFGRLRAAGLTQVQLGGLSSPIGLDLGGRTPQETAISIAAEIVASRWGGSGIRLTELAGAIHHDSGVAAASGC